MVLLNKTQYPLNEVHQNIDKMKGLMDMMDISITQLVKLTYAKFSYHSMVCFFRKTPAYVTAHTYEFFYDYFRPLLVEYDKIRELYKKGVKSDDFTPLNNFIIEIQEREDQPIKQ